MVGGKIRRGVELKLKIEMKSFVCLQPAFPRNFSFLLQTNFFTQNLAVNLKPTPQKAILKAIIPLREILLEKNSKKVDLFYPIHSLL